jgi:hypothetical protein
VGCATAETASSAKNEKRKIERADIMPPAYEVKTSSIKRQKSNKKNQSARFEF